MGITLVTFGKGLVQSSLGAMHTGDPPIDAISIVSAQLSERADWSFSRCWSDLGSVLGHVVSKDRDESASEHVRGLGRSPAPSLAVSQVFEMSLNDR